MGYLPSLPENAHLIMNVWKTFPKGLPELLAYIDVVMRGESELSIADRELVSAYVSAINHCDFCVNAHAAFAEEYGADPELTDACKTGDCPPVDDKMKPIYDYAGKLTREPHSVTQADVQAILDAGWSEQTVHDTASVVGLFNHMVRIVSGLGVSGHADMFNQMRDQHRATPIEERKAKGAASQGKPQYAGFLQMLGMAA